MKTDDEEHSLKSILRKRSFGPRKSSLKAEICNIIDKQRQEIQEAGAHLIWKRTSEQSLKYDVLVIIPPKGFHIIDSLLQMMSERLPNLIVEIKPHSYNKEQAFYITANEDYLFDGAKILGYQLQHTLTSLQRQTIILHFINSLRWIKTDTKSHTMEQEFKNLKFNHGDAIIAKLISLKFIKQVLPLHNESDLSQLRVEWVSAFFSFQPLDKICQYFGLKIGIYFAFLGYYTFALIFPATLGVLVFIIDNNSFIGQISTITFPLINIIWSTIFLQKWKYFNKKLVRQWSSIDFGTTVNFVRPLFRGNLVHNMNSFECIQIEYPEWKRKLFKYLVTFPVIALSLLICFRVMFAVFEFQTWWDDVLIVQSGYPLWTSYIPKILLAILISIFDSIYYQIAIWLNNQENYQFETVHENNLILKLVLFQFGNSFLPLFYIAFYVGDMDKLREQLAALLITRQVIGNIKESILPFVMESYKLSPKIKNENLSQGELEASMFRYDSTFDDYLELIIQFGYVLLFSSTFPLAAICALINNLIEIRSDAFKLCVVYQRPFAGDMVKDIGEWENVMNYLVYIAILVNCALIAKTKQISQILPVEDDVHIVIFSVFIEHLLLAIKWLSPFII